MKIYIGTMNYLGNKQKISRSRYMLELIEMIFDRVYSSKIKIELSRTDQERLEHWLHLQQYIERPFDGLFRHLV